MVRRDDFQKVSGFDEKYFIMYEEADLAHQIKKQLGKKIYLISRAVTYHDFPLHDPEVQNNLGLRSSERAYLTARNRVYFMRKNAPWFHFMVFFFVFNPLILFYYEILLLKNRQFAKARAYLRGCLAGFFL
jgi:GT2 family glycosyltransferase